MTRKTRIQRKGKYEVVCVPLLAEDLQDKWEDLQDLKNEMIDLTEEALELSGGNEHVLMNQHQELCKKIDEGRMKGQIADASFWIELRRRYDLWGFALGIRDGYAVVKRPTCDHTNL